MGRLKIRKKLQSRRTPDATLPDSAPCWCDSGFPYVECHKLWDLVHDRRDDKLLCTKPGQ